MNWPTAATLIVFFLLCAVVITVTIGAIVAIFTKGKEKK